MENFIKEEEKDFLNIFQRLKKRDFSGNTGQAIKNSTYQIATSLVYKISSIIFTIVVARLLMPELYGLYGLALSTIVLFMAFSDFGIGTALLTFIAKNIDIDKKKAKGYYNFLFKYKLILIVIISFILIVTSYYISNIYYNKPIFYALLAGALYIPTYQLMTYFIYFFVAQNNLKIGLINETIVQFLRLIFVPLAIILFLGKVNNEILLLIIFLVITFAYFVGMLFLYFSIHKQKFIEIKEEQLTKDEKKELNKFILPLSITALSGLFFGSIDLLILGHFVESIFLGYFQAAFNLIGSATAIVAFSGTALFPILSKLKGEQFEKGFNKGMIITGLIAISATIFTFTFAKWIILIIYGKEYINAVLLLQLLSLLLINIPLCGLYGSYYFIQKKTKMYSVLLIISTLINIILNYLFIIALLPQGMMQAVIGSCVATIISRYMFLFGLIFFRKR
ncbi:MAG TPA: oligosaccharide flippase family protein [Nanoarchaeota archaeon]|nr:oligosaccharide flippase family protein [Nanoarchaeota archaeon]HIH63893.1 oligosaccharide flippase family protein [Nanoarchaeota archaeon]HIJ09792.1 oligosaccharide flippase family protein [Nanoarchaeota archaeon]